jgi:hypothetical protein
MSLSELKKRPVIYTCACLLAALALAFTSLYVARRALAEEYTTIWSPDARYKIVVYGYPMLPAMPGQGGDASGFVRLYDKDGRVLEEKDVDMVQLIEQVDWEEGKVDIKLFAKWALPQ